MSALRPYLSIIILLLLSFAVTWPLFQTGYFSHQDNLQVMRIFEMKRCLIDGQIPCRWVPDMGYGNGLPLFNYYGVLPYFIGALFSFVTSYIVAAKILFLIPLALAGVSIYFLVRELYGDLAGFTSGVLLLFAPYRAVDSYVRGAIAESFAISLLPLILYFFLKLATSKSRTSFVGAVLSLAAFLTCHNIMTLFFMPVILGWLVICLYLKGGNSYKLLFSAFLIGVGVATFFVLPAYLEKSLVQTETLTRYELDFRANFAAVSQLFTSRFWGYGASVSGSEDGLSFQIGWPHWWLVIVAAVLMLIKRGDLKAIILPVYFLIVFSLSVFMIHNKSAFVWEALPLIQFAQFPWRFLSVSIISASFLGGYIIYKTNSSVVAAIIIAVTIVLNVSYFRPHTFFNQMTDRQLLIGPLWEEQQRAAILDYLPKTAVEPREGAPDQPLIESGAANLDDLQIKTNSWSFRAVVQQPAVVIVPVYDFYNWRVRANNSAIDHQRDSIGRIRVDLPIGNYVVQGKLEDTMVRTVSNTISLLSLIVLVLLWFYGKTYKVFR